MSASEPLRVGDCGTVPEGGLVTREDDIEVHATIINSGTEQGTGRVEFVAGGEQIGEQEVSVAPGESVTVEESFSVKAWFAVGESFDVDVRMG